MSGCTQEANYKLKLMLPRHLLRPCLEYVCAVWTPYTAHDIGLFESVHYNRVVHWIRSYWDPSAFKWSKSFTICIKELGWPSLKVCQQYIAIYFNTIFYFTWNSCYWFYFQFNTFATQTLF